MKVVVFGVTGMLGHAMFRILSEDSRLIVYGTARKEDTCRYFSDQLNNRLITGVDVENYDSLVGVFTTVNPDVVVNCVGIIKQLPSADDPLQAIPINALLPHQLAMLCQKNGKKARLIHFSTDCVFSGIKGNYIESDIPDSWDLYGRSKLLGEVDCVHAVTLRTSMIGHELSGKRSLLNWFLAQEKSVRGFARAIFSGLTTVELARVVHNVILRWPDLYGIYHVGAQAINKFELLNLISKIYQKEIEIIRDESLVVDRSLNSERFMKATGYVSPEWPLLIQNMYDLNSQREIA